MLDNKILELEREIATQQQVLRGVPSMHAEARRLGRTIISAFTVYMRVTEAIMAERLARLEEPGISMEEMMSRLEENLRMR